MLLFRKRAINLISTFFYLCYLNSFTYTSVQHDFHIRLCSFRLTVTRQEAHVEQELLTLSEHMSSPPPSVARSLVYCAKCCPSLLVFLTIFKWPLYSLSFYNLRLLIIPLVSSIFSFIKTVQLFF